MKYVQQNKLFRDVESLSKRFAAAIRPERPQRPWTPAANVCAGVLARLVAMLAAWGTPTGEGISRRLVAAFAPVVLDIARLTEIAVRYIPRDRAAELARSVTIALADGVRDPRDVVPEMIEDRRSRRDLTISDEVAEALGTAMTRACSPGPTAEDLQALETALRSAARAIADAAVINTRIREAA